MDLKLFLAKSLIWLHYSLVLIGAVATIAWVRVEFFDQQLSFQLSTSKAHRLAMKDAD